MYGWVLNTDLWLWQAIEWVQFRIPIVAQARRWQRPPLTARPPLQPPPGFVVAVEARPAPPAAALAGTVHGGCAALPGSCPEACPPAGQRSRHRRRRRHPRRPRIAPSAGLRVLPPDAVPVHDGAHPAAGRHGVGGACVARPARVAVAHLAAPLLRLRLLRGVLRGRDQRLLRGHGLPVAERQPGGGGAHARVRRRRCAAVSRACACLPHGLLPLLCALSPLCLTAINAP